MYSIRGLDDLGQVNRLVDELQLRFNMKDSGFDDDDVKAIATEYNNIIVHVWKNRYATVDNTSKNYPSELSEYWYKIGIETEGGYPNYSEIHDFIFGFEMKNLV